MRASMLKKKYPELWSDVYNQVLGNPEPGAIGNTRQIMAHNTAFVACAYFHKFCKEIIAHITNFS
jgi:hypothetical protein